eukprot:3563935-Prymnesium_polylepis.2
MARTTKSRRTTSWRLSVSRLTARRPSGVCVPQSVRSTRRTRAAAGFNLVAVRGRREWLDSIIKRKRMILEASTLFKQEGKLPQPRAFIPGENSAPACR